MTQREETFRDMALLFEQNGDPKRALKWYRKIQGSGAVYEIVGEYYYLGRGCEKNTTKAAEYFEKAAKLGETDAICNLALCTDDKSRKLELYKAAADAGVAYAMNMVGIVLEESDQKGAGTPEEWFRKAAYAGLVEGCYNYALNTEDVDEKLKYLRLAADQNFLPALEKLAFYLEQGIYLDSDRAAATAIRKKIQVIQMGTK